MAQKFALEDIHQLKSIITSLKKIFVMVCFYALIYTLTLLSKYLKVNQLK